MGKPRKSVPVGRNSTCKSPELDTCLECLNSSEEPSRAAAGQRAGGRRQGRNGEPDEKDSPSLVTESWLGSLEIILDTLPTE